MTMFTHGSLFSGIGGFDLASEWMGWENKLHCEIDPFCRRVLKYYWPNSISYEDIKQTDFTIWQGRIDVLTGGFPCQPYSIAGKRKGKDDERHLWPEMLRAIREIKPRWVVGENVRGLVNWNGGVVFEEVQVDLENEGYEVFPCLLPACGVNAPHRRDRIWIIACSDSYGYRRKHQSGKDRCKEGKSKTIKEEWKRVWNDNWGIVPKRDVTNHDRCTNWYNFPTQPTVCFRNDGISPILDGITVSKWRKESIKAAGNAIVPQVALQIFKAIEQYEKKHQNFW